MTAEESAAGRHNPYNDDYRAILELAGIVHSSDVRADLIMLAAAYRRLADVASAPRVPADEPFGNDPDGRCSRFLQDAFREEIGESRSR